MNGELNLADRLARFDEYWAPRNVATCNGHDIILVKVLAELACHDR